MALCFFCSCFSLILTFLNFGFFVKLVRDSNKVFARHCLLLNNDDQRITALEISMECLRGENHGV